MAWVVFLVILVPVLGILVWVLLDDSVVRIPPGRLGLLLVRGVGTDTTLGPGVHWVPAFRRRMVAEYPARELAYRAGDPSPVDEDEDELARTGPPIRALLGDRTTVSASYTVRFRLDRAMVRSVHDRFGVDGIWAAVRDESERTLRESLGAERFGIDDLFGARRVELEQALAEDLTASLAAAGLVVTMFAVGDVDLGRAGDVIQATVRARLELDREEAEAAMRITRARIDADLGAYIDVATTEAALRYREVDAWRDAPPAMGAGPLAHSATRASSPAPSGPPDEPAPTPSADSAPIAEGDR